MTGTTPCSVPRPTPPDLVERLALEMTSAWRRGDRAPAETYLARHPELLDNAEQAVRLVYEEVCLRQECGEEVAADELARRFPRWAGELAVLLDCHHLMRSRLPPPVFPAVGESLGDFRVVAELGRGAQGRVFLATQPALADRPVVLKVTPRGAREHLSLARLQHTHIIPLHAVYDFPDRNLRALCLPFLGGATLARVLDLLRGRPVAQRTGQSLLDALDAAQQDAPVHLPGRGVYRQALAGVSYVEAVCRIGACLADGLHYAHERGLVHLDLKPSNVLLTADAQPLLLDFHLAVRPLPAGQPAPEWFGGTPGYMSPEQEAACAAARRGGVAALDVDGRSDIYALGRLLYVALAGDDEADARPLPPLHRRNPQVSVGLSDIVHKCLARSPDDRYPDAAALAADLRRHLAHLPLRGVRNRDLRERWRKWRRRRPHAALWAGLLLALAAGGAALAAGAVERYRDARAAPAGGQGQVKGEAAAPQVEPAGEGATLGRSLLESGELARAAEELERATDRRPQDFWAHFYRGVCAYRQRHYDLAVHSFGVAVALAPESAECYYNRALAYAARGEHDRALGDYDRALALAPRLAAAELNRGVLHYQQGRLSQALADLERALLDGAEPATAHYNLALVQLAMHDRAAARRHLDQALDHDPAHAEARSLQERLRRQK
jgi:serine/threonine protein kinase/Tfp pilus assembly protein PilF